MKTPIEAIELIELYLEGASQEYINACIYGYRTTNLTAYMYSKLNKEYMPNKGNTFAYVYILKQIDLKYCSKCKRILDISEFSMNSKYKDNKQSECIDCNKKYKKDNPEKFREYASKRKAVKINRTPKWLSKKEIENIKIFYYNCQEGYQVDHIIPLQGKSVSGLHMLSNLQYLSKFDNLSKGNKFNIEQFN